MHGAITEVKDAHFMRKREGQHYFSLFKLTHRSERNIRRRRAMNERTATSEVQIDNLQLRVTEWRFLPGAATGYHRHECDYVVVPILDGELELVGPDGQRSRARLQQGKSYFRNAGVEHDVINIGSDVMAFVEIELKR